MTAILPCWQRGGRVLQRSRLAEVESCRGCVLPQRLLPSGSLRLAIGLCVPKAPLDFAAIREPLTSRRPLRHAERVARANCSDAKRACGLHRKCAGSSVQRGCGLRKLPRAWHLEARLQAAGEKREFSARYRFSTPSIRRNPQVELNSRVWTRPRQIQISPERMRGHEPCAMCHLPCAMCHVP